jgi:predicted nucleic acid-binding protein
MPAKARVFLDTSVLFAAVLSETGGSRFILKLGEAGAIRLSVGPRVLQEAECVLEYKAPQRKALFALLLDRANVAVGPAPDGASLEQANDLIAYAPDAHVLAEAIAAGSDYLVSLDRKHLVGNPRLAALSFPVGTPGDFLAWFRERVQLRPGESVQAA